MKTMTCRQLGGACDEKFSAATFEEMANLSKKHGMDMHEKGDEAHQKAMGEMAQLMEDPQKMQEWMDARKKEFDELAED